MIRASKSIYSDEAQFDSTRLDGRIAYYVAISVLGRVLVEQKGGDWPPFAVSFTVPCVDGAMAPTNPIRAPWTP